MNGFGFNTKTILGATDGPLSPCAMGFSAVKAS